MAKGKKTCRILKEIRRQIAEANDIEYVVEECQYKGDCLGTCPKCEAEVRYLERQLQQRQLLGKAVMLTGVSASLFTLGSCGNEMYDHMNNQEDGVVLKGGKEAIPVFDVVGRIAEQVPTYPGGTAAMMKFLSENIKYPEQMLKDSVQGRVVCKFVVGMDGTISNVSVARSIHPLLDAEAVRVISLMPNWIPGMREGKAAEVNYTLPVTFRIEAESDSTKVNKQ